MDPSFLPYRQAAKHILSIIESNNIEKPLIGIICGSGLSGLSEAMTSTYTISYKNIPGFPTECTVAGHKGEMVFGLLGGIPVLCFRGRFHSYEGHSMSTTALPVRIMRCLQSIKLVILTNAAGGLNASYEIGDVVCIMDHFALPMLAGKNPLIGPNDEELGPRFPATSNAYNPSLQQIVLNEAAKLVENKKFQNNFVKQNGTYCFVSGPMYESRAECKFLRDFAGGDCVGMSTVPEILAAHHSGLKVLCLSLITNKVIITGEEGPAATHEEVLEATQKRAKQVQELVKEVVSCQEMQDFLNGLEDLKPITLA